MSRRRGSGSVRLVVLVIALVAAVVVRLACWEGKQSPDPDPSWQASSDEEATGDQDDGMGETDGSLNASGDEAAADRSRGGSSDVAGSDAPASSSLPDANVCSSEEVALGLEEAARMELEQYRRGASCVLVDAGYLDLLGKVWSCTVQGDGWVEICVVRELEAGGEGSGNVADRSKITHVRMEASAWSADAPQGG